MGAACGFAQSGWSEEAFLGLLNQLAALVLGVACE
jgi:hypothetical protein